MPTDTIYRATLMSAKPGTFTHASAQARHTKKKGVAPMIRCEYRRESDCLRNIKKHGLEEHYKPMPYDPCINNYSKKEAYKATLVDRASFGETNDCAVIAIAVATGVSYTQAHETLAKLGRKKRRGTYPSTTLQAMATLGFQCVKMPMLFFAGKTKRTIHKCLLPESRYLIRVSRHIFAGINGQVEDYGATKLNRIASVWEVVPNKLDKS